MAVRNIPRMEGQILSCVTVVMVTGSSPSRRTLAVQWRSIQERTLTSQPSPPLRYHTVCVCVVMVTAGCRS